MMSLGNLLGLAERVARSGGAADIARNIHVEIAPIKTLQLPDATPPPTPTETADDNPLPSAGPETRRPSLAGLRPPQLEAARPRGEPMARPDPGPSPGSGSAPASRAPQAAAEAASAAAAMASLAPQESRPASRGADPVPNSKAAADADDGKAEVTDRRSGEPARSAPPGSPAAMPAIWTRPAEAGDDRRVILPDGKAQDEAPSDAPAERRSADRPPAGGPAARPASWTRAAEAGDDRRVTLADGPAQEAPSDAPAARRSAERPPAGGPAALPTASLPGATGHAAFDASGPHQDPTTGATEAGETVDGRPVETSDPGPAASGRAPPARRGNPTDLSGRIRQNEPADRDDPTGRGQPTGRAPLATRPHPSMPTVAAGTAAVETGDTASATGRDEPHLPAVLVAGTLASLARTTVSEAVTAATDAIAGEETDDERLVARSLDDRSATSRMTASRLRADAPVTARGALAERGDTRSATAESRSANDTRASGTARDAPAARSVDRAVVPPPAAPAAETMVARAVVLLVEADPSLLRALALPAAAAAAMALDGVILNAAMIPGYPAPRPLAGTQPEGVRQQVPQDGQETPLDDKAEAALEAYLGILGLPEAVMTQIRAILADDQRRRGFLLALARMLKALKTILGTLRSELEALAEDLDGELSAGGGERRGGRRRLPI